MRNMQRTAWRDDRGPHNPVTQHQLLIGLRDEHSCGVGFYGLMAKELCDAQQLRSDQVRPVDRLGKLIWVNLVDIPDANSFSRRELNGFCQVPEDLLDHGAELLKA